MKIVRLLPFTIVILCFNISVFASPGDGQFLPGYVITPAGDSIRGYVLIQDNAFNSKKCLFRKSLTDDTRTYLPVELAGYGADDKKYYSSFNLGEDDKFTTVFLEFIIMGKNSLLFYKNRYFIKTLTGTEELVVKNKLVVQEGRSFNIKQAVYKSTLQAAMNDCSEVGTLIQATVLNEESLRKLFAEYDKCIGHSSYVSPIVSEKINVRFGLSATYLWSKLVFYPGTGATTLYLVDRSTESTTLAPSFWMELSKPRFRNRIRTGVSLISTSHQTSTTFGPSNQIRAISVKASRLQIPLQWRIAFSKRPDHGAYGLLGVGMGIFVKWEQLLTVQQISPSLDLLNLKDTAGSDLFLNATIGLGYEFKIGSKSFFIEGIYSSNPIVSKLSEPDMSYRDAGFTAGIYF